MALDARLLEILACPQDKGPLLYFADEAVLYNPRLRRKYRIEDDIPNLLVDESVEVTAAEDARLLALARARGLSLEFPPLSALPEQP